VVSTTLGTIALALLMLIAYLLFFSGLTHARTQHIAYADFRKELALGTAPTGPTDPDDPTKPLALGSAVAVLSMPTIGVHEVVFEGTTGSVLEKGPGHLRSSVLPGQAGSSVLYGRATTFGGPFGEINQLQPGDRFTVTTGQGIQQYKVLDVRRAGDPVPPAPAGTSDRLVLDTADGPPLIASGVLRVDADLTSPLQPTPTQIVTNADLSSAELALGTDGSAWIPLVLWGQALLIAAVFVAILRRLWTKWQVWVVAVPIMAFFAFGVAATATRLLPNFT
jgi:sortase (surface protein transpeptidase)